MFRRCYYSHRLKSLGKAASICANVTITGAPTVSIGDNVVINENAIIQGAPSCSVQIGNNVHIAYGATILTGNLDDKDRSKHVYAPVVIEDNAVIGARAVVLPGITVGAGSVVAPGSVVTQNVAPHTMVFGVPARKIKDFEPAASEPNAPTS